jgi:uncharacterized protein (DUF2225 family)
MGNVQMTSLEIKHWKGKFSCPVCNKLRKDEKFFMGDHMLDKHTKKEIADVVFDTLVRAAMGKPIWIIRDV